MKKCKGCGIELQYENKDLPGYSPNETFDYCQRCFRLTHYGDTSKVNTKLSENKKILNSYKEINDALFVLVIDCFDALIVDQDGFLDSFLDKDVLLVINKIDLLPKNITEDKIYDLYKKQLSKYGHLKNLDCVLTYKNDQSFIEMFFSIMKEKHYKKAVFIGRVNAGKSSLINKLIENKDLTTSIYPGTTVNLNTIEFNDYVFVDTPGLLDSESYITYIDKKLVKNILPLKTLKGQNFQSYENQSYSIEGLVQITIKTNKNTSILFLVNNNLEVHRTKYDNAENYLNRNVNSFKLKLLPFTDNVFKVNKYATFYLKGLGIIKVKGNVEVNIRYNDKINVYKNEVNI